MTYRTQVYLRQGQHAALKREAAARRKSMTALLRDCLDEYLERIASPPSGLRAITALGASGEPSASRKHDEIFARTARD